jgi:hypothetical protein
VGEKLSDHPSFQHIATAYALLIKRSGLSDHPVVGERLTPVNKVQEDTDLLKMVLLPPKPRIPKDFWDQTWCHYSVAYGRHAKFDFDRGRPFEWHISFLHSPGNENCGHGRYKDRVTTILLETASKKPHQFFVVKHGDPRPDRDARVDGWPYVHILRRYYSKDVPKITPETIAEDLAWLVQETFPRFLLLQA